MLVSYTYEIGRNFTRYMTLAHVAQEGARYLATLPGLEEETHQSSEVLAVGGHRKAHDRIRNLLAQNGLSASSITFETKFIKTASGTMPAYTVRVRMVAENEPPLFPIPGFYTISTERLSGYLYPPRPGQ